MENKKYSILIICIYGAPGHTERFVNNLKQTNPNASISLYSDRDKEAYSTEMLNCIDEYFQREKYLGWPYRIGRFRKNFDHYAFVRQFRRLSKTHHYNIINIHYPQYILSDVIRYLKRMSDSIVVTPWGSDVLRLEDPQKKKKLTCLFTKVDYITTRPSGSIGKVVCQEMKVDPSKFHPLVWGSDTIDYINDHIAEVSHDAAKERLGLKGKYLITCGYNAYKEQQHEIIIDAIKRKKDELPDNITLLFPVTYGNVTVAQRQEYVARLKSLCEDLHLPTIFYENYMSVSQLFLIRRATNMFIHIQTTDAGNSSLQEYVLCGAKIVHGSWIHYDTLEKYSPLFYFPVSELDDLGNVIVDAFNSDPIHTPIQVIETIRNRGWRACMKLWNDFFVSSVND